MKYRRSPQYFIGVDVGGTKIEAVVVNMGLTEAAHSRVPVETENAGRVTESIALAIQNVLDEVQPGPQELCGIGLGIPGLVNDGKVHLAVNLNMDDYPLAAILSKRFGAPVALENDVRLAALGAYGYVQLQTQCQNMAYLSIGTGISAGLILNGQLYRGANGMAGEIGHVIIQPGGPVCSCGAHGCLESVASGHAIADTAREAVAAGRVSSLSACPLITTQDVFEAAEKQDPLALEIVGRVGRYLSQAIQWLVMGYDVERVVLGGGVTHTAEVFMPAVQAGLEQIRSESELAERMLPLEKVVLMPGDYNAGLWGAVRLARTIK
jgi:glucokinase